MSIFRNVIAKKCQNLSVGKKYFPITVNIFPLQCQKYVTMFFSSTAFVDKIIRGNKMYNLFHQLVVNMRVSQK